MVLLARGLYLRGQWMRRIIAEACNAARQVD